MIFQTITLIQFLLLNYSQRKNVTPLLLIILFGFLAAEFVAELSLINSQEAQFAFQIEFYRYALILLSALILLVAIADDFASKQFESLLSMPLARWQYIVAQIGAIAVVNIAIVVLASIVLLLQADFNLVLIWCYSIWLELMLCSMMALLAILSLEKIPNAMMLLLSLYLLSRSSRVIIEIIEQSVYYSSGDTLNKIILSIFQLISFVLPNTHAFLQNNLFYTLNTAAFQLAQQSAWVALYSLFLLAIIVFDFYRKEFALNKA